MKPMRLIGILCLLFAICYVQCTSSPPGLANNGGSEVVGKLIDKKGNNVQNARVIAIKIDSNTVADTSFADTVFSDIKGEYSFKKLVKGVYNLSGFHPGDSLTFLHKNVHNDSLAPLSQPPIRVSVGTDTMLPPGSIFGQVQLDYVTSTSMAGVSCFIPGTSYLALTDDTGYFKITNVPVGIYTVKFRYVTTGYGFIDTQVQNVSVKSTDSTDIGQIKMHLSGDGNPPAPLGLKFSYDTLSGQVALKWNKVPVPDFLNYKVFRQKSNNPAGFLSAAAFIDTFFIDTITFTDTMGYSVYYEVQCFDNSGHFSDFSSSISFAVHPPAGKTTVSFTGTTSAGLYDPGTIIASYTNKTAPVDTIIWTTSNVNSIHVVNKNSGSDTLKIQCAPIGKKTVYCKTIDGLGRKSMDSTFVNIVQDKPVITFLSPDQTINFGGMAQCSIAVSHQFGPCTLRVHLKGNASPEIKRVGLGFDSSFSTGAALTWDSVKIKISDSHGNSIDTGFSITIIPPTPSDQWIEYASMNGHHRLHASEAINGTLYAIGGCMAQWVGSGTNNTVPVKTVEAYDTLLKTWTIKDSLLNARYDFATCAHGGQIYAVGGIGKKEYVSVMEQYDPLGDKWTIFDTMQVGTNQFTRAGSASCLVGNKLYLFGGKTPLDLQGYDSVCQTIYVYDFTSKNWSETIHMLMPRYDFQAIQINGKIYLIGGLDADDMPLQSIEIFDPNAGTCTPGPSMSSGLSNFAAAAVGGKLYLIGGINSASNLILNSLNMFDPAANAWSSRASLPQPRHSMSACVINGTIYVTGGINNFDPALDETTDKVLMKYFP